MRTVALFGGAFDPPHVGHLLVIANLLKHAHFDQVWIVPTGSRNDKPHLASNQQRQEMLNLALQTENFGKNRVRIETCQISGLLPGSYTVDLIDYLQSKYPDTDFSFVIGTDNLAQLFTWKEAQRLFCNIEFYAVPRPGQKIQEFPGIRVRHPDTNNWQQSTVSSSEIRAAIKSGQTTLNLLPAAVAEYIHLNGLYSPPR